MAEFDAIIVGSGMSGGWVAKELCERGLKTLVLERGPDISPGEDYSDMLDPWEKAHLDQVRPDEALAHYQRQKDVYVFYESTKHFWVRDSDQPYTTAPGTDFEWYRGNHVGGRSLTWARMSFRFGDLDFTANLKDGVGVDWPIRYADLEPWYDKVEGFVGVSGDMPDLPTLPKGRYLPPFEMNCAEEKLKATLERRFDDRTLIVAPVANLKRAQAHHNALGRGDCQARNLCYRGCSFGAYFSSNSATLPAARRTGNMTLITATGLPAKGLGLWRLTQSNAFFKTPGMAALYSGVEMIMPSAASICATSASTEAGSPSRVSSSPL